MHIPIVQHRLDRNNLAQNSIERSHSFLYLLLPVRKTVWSDTVQPFCKATPFDIDGMHSGHCPGGEEILWLADVLASAQAAATIRCSILRPVR